MAGGRTYAHDMTSGPIVQQLVLFALPLIVGNLFQQLYNTVDSLVVGNFVSMQALAAVGSTASIINTLVMFFNGVSIGAGAVISRFYGAHDDAGLHRSIETTIGLTALLSVLFTAIGYFSVPYTLRFMSTPEDVLADAATYLHIYYLGFAGLFFYNIGSAIMRAVGDTRRPLYFLIFTSILNVILDLFFVLVLHHAIDGVAYATIISQGISAVLVMMVLTRSTANYHITWQDVRIERELSQSILGLGLPIGLQQSITALSNVFVQGYINVHGSYVMAGWSIYTKMDQFVFLPITSMSQSATTFVSQNMGAKKYERALRGTVRAVQVAWVVTTIIFAGVWAAAPTLTKLFTSEEEAVRFGTQFLRLNLPLFIVTGTNHTLAGGLRGLGNARDPMLIFLLGQVVLRQIYLFVMTKIIDEPWIVALSFPFGWTVTCIMMYFCYRKTVRKVKAMEAAENAA